MYTPGPGMGTYSSSPQMRAPGAIMPQVHAGNPAAGHFRNAQSSFHPRTCNMFEISGSRSPNSRRVAKPISRENLIATTLDSFPAATAQLHSNVGSPSVQFALHWRWRSAGVAVAPRSGCHARGEISSTRAEQLTIDQSLSGPF
jgi:hypothetical protein